MSPAKTPPDVVEKIKKEWGQNYERVPRGTQKPKRNIGCWLFGLGLGLGVGAYWLLNLIF